MSPRLNPAAVAVCIVLGPALGLVVGRDLAEAAPGDPPSQARALTAVPLANMEDPADADYKLKVCDGLPEIDKEKVMSILQTIEASFHRHERVSFMKMYTTSSLDVTKFAYSDMYRTCKVSYFQDSQSCKAATSSNHVAVAMTGKTRYFTDQAVLQFWKGVASAVQASGRTPVLLTVFDEAEGTGPAAVSLVARMEDFASRVKNPKLRSILTPLDEKEAAWFQEPAASDHRRRVQVLDSILQYEQDHDLCFSHILYARPDFIYPQWTNVNTLAYAWAHMIDVTYLVGNMTAIIPRRAAGAFFTTFAMHRTLQNEQFKSLLGSFFSDGDEGLMQPSTNLAYHGYLFAGAPLKTKYKSIPYPGFDDQHEPGFFVGERGPGQYCVGGAAQQRWINLPACAA